MATTNEHVSVETTSTTSKRTRKATPATGAAKKVISSFAGFEEEYKKFVSSVEKNDSTEIQLIKGILHVFVTDKLHKEVIDGVEAAAKIAGLKYEQAEHDSVFAEYGRKVVGFWNEKYNAPSMQVSSVRIVPEEDEDKSVLVTVKDSYSIKDDMIVMLKEEMGAAYDEIFEEEEILKVKQERAGVLLKLVETCFDGVGKVKEFFFDSKISVSMRDSKKFQEYLKSDKVSENLKGKLRMACEQQKPTIKYPVANSK